MRTNRPLAMAAALSVVAAGLLGASAPLATAGGRRCLGREATKVGTPKNDTIVGTSDGDVILGLGGHDVILGITGSDVVCGGPGDDLIDPGFHPDRASGGPGSDVLAFEWAHGEVRASLATGTARARGWTDRFSGFEGLYGSPYDDHLTGNGKTNYITGEGGRDVVRAGGGNDLLVGDYNPNGYGDVLDGGPGRGDVVSYYSYRGSYSVRASLAENDPYHDRFVGVEGLEGPRDEDHAVLQGDSGVNGLFSGGGSVTLQGLGGDDLLKGGASQIWDHLDGHAGDDYIVGGGGVDNIEGGLTNDEPLGGGNDVIDAGAGDDDVFGGAGDDRILLGGGADRVETGAGEDFVLEGRGDDFLLGGPEATLSYESWAQAIAVDLARETVTGAGTDHVSGFGTIVATPLGDTIAGDDDPNVVYALAGDDVVSGEAGDDHLFGGEGNDSADGGPGIDECVDFELALWCESVPVPPSPPPAVDGPLDDISWPTLGAGASIATRPYDGPSFGDLAEQLARLRLLAAP